MRNQLRLALLFVIGLSFCQSVATSQEEAEHPYAQAKVGNYLLYLSTINIYHLDTPVDQPIFKAQLETALEVTEKTATSVKIKSEAIGRDQITASMPLPWYDYEIDLTQPFDLRDALKMFTNNQDKDGTTPQVDIIDDTKQETITLHNVTYDCQVIEVTIATSNTLSHIKLWLDPSKVLLSGLVKAEKETTAMGIKTIVFSTYQNTLLGELSTTKFDTYKPETNGLESIPIPKKPIPPQILPRAYRFPCFFPSPRQ